ncbi:MAG: DUF1573 domain-containing protein [Daejeonella sp.]|uniref:DUF1573 domain-containing protein n=1 Tax=Daejeonella sp. TaxID=2805397 RepID=UPI002733AB4B|nr:DUF1573 domain-containing protein [Daejeonella sp.]MDP3470039.1 DUF1573 domain-containing protein [Daejeonella sp.]
MRKIFLSIACLVVLAACNNQQSVESTADSKETSEIAAIDTANAPAFKFEKEVYDFGKINDGEVVTYDFKFKNIGNTPLIISSATATCGCTVPQYPKEPVAPGAEGVIRVVFDSAGKPGMQNKIVSLTANTIPSLTELNILGMVEAAEKK